MSKTPCSSIDFLGRLPDLRPGRRKFPAIFPASREFGRRERFASACLIRHSVLDVGYSLRSLPEIRAYRPNLDLMRHQRQASSSDSVRNSALYLCFEFRWGREEP
jgi:hypothetical protein